MTIHERREQAAIRESGYGDVIGRGLEMSHNLIVFDKALQLMAGRVVATATETVGEVIGIEILNGGSA
jgi:hypothetical protein